MEEELEVILRAVDEASDTFESVTSAAENMGESVQGGAEAGSSGLNEMEESASAAEDPLEGITSIIGGLAGAEIFSQLADTLWDFADKAGSFEDSMMRARLEAEGAGISVNDMTDTVSELTRVTGRAGGEIRESFIKATARGITDMDSFKKMMVGAGAQATLLGTDIQSMGDKFSSMAMRSTLMERQLASTGITMEELGNAMGLTGATADEVKAKWEELDTNQRAAALGMAASMNEGQTANEEYKKSWAGLQEQLDIAKGRLERLAGEVLLPVLIPALQVAGRVLNWLGDTVSAVMSGPFGGLISVVGAAAAAFALAVPAYMAVQGAITLLTATAIPAATALWAMVSPLIPFIAIGAAVVLIIYEIGKAFGWWTDASSMIDAIWAGLQRLWSAFINHPDVQGFLTIMGQAWNVLSSAIGGVINWLGSFFNISSGGEFDVVRALITGISAAWQGMTFPIRTVINILMWLKNVFVQVASGQLTLSSVMSSIWIAIQTFLSGMLTRIAVRILQWGTQIYTYAVNAARKFVTGIINYIKGLPGKILGYLVKTGSNIQKQGNNWVKNAKTKASQVVSGTVSYMRGLPGKVGTYVSNTATKISTGAQKWVTNATNKASKVVSGVIGYVNDLPGKVATEISNTASRMLSAGSSLITNAKNIGRNIVKGLLDSMKIHSPGEIQTKVIKEFEDTVSHIGNMTGTAYKTGASFGSALVDGFGDPSLNPGIEALNVFSEQPTQKLEVHYTHDYNFEGLPDTVSAKEVASMINEAAISDEWTKKLTSNPRFQMFDSKEKARLNRRQARSRGV